MKRNRYTLMLFWGVLFMLLCSIDLMAQRGRYFRGPFRGYYPRHAPVRVFAYNNPFISINFGGTRYRYQQGFFYRPYGTVFTMVMPPIGIRVTALPRGYRRVMVGPNPYYYYNGIYYRDRPDRQFEVVEPPLGATVDRLPPGAKVSVINGEKYYELNGTYYQETISEDNAVHYTVVGVDGVLDTTTVPVATQDPAQSETHETEEVPVYTGPQIGDRLENLPTGSKSVVINGEKFYSSPGGYYYKEVKEGNKVLYEVVGGEEF